MWGKQGVPGVARRSGSIRPGGTHRALRLGHPVTIPHAQEGSRGHSPVRAGLIDAFHAVNRGPNLRIMPPDEIVICDVIFFTVGDTI